jgi:hypothetical protein
MELATWGEVCAHLGSRAREHGAGLEVEVTLQDGAKEHVQVSAIDVGSLTCVEVVGVVGPARFMSPKQALAMSSEGPIGALGFSGDELVVRQVVPLAPVLARDLDDVVLAIATQCVIGRKLLS